MSFLKFEVWGITIKYIKWEDFEQALTALQSLSYQKVFMNLKNCFLVLKNFLLIQFAAEFSPLLIPVRKPFWQTMS